jgi:hypothetical protein
MDCICFSFLPLRELPETISYRCSDVRLSFGVDHVYAELSRDRRAHISSHAS